MGKEMRKYTARDIEEEPIDLYAAALVQNLQVTAAQSDALFAQMNFSQPL